MAKPEAPTRPAAPDRAATRRKKAKRVVPEGIAHIHSTFNNTIVTITDPTGNVVAWASAGNVGFKGSRKGTPFAAQLAAEAAAKRAIDVGMRSVQVFVKGPGAGRESALRIATGGGLRDQLDQGRDPDSAQRMSSAEATTGLTKEECKRGSLPSVRMPAVPA